MGHYTVAALYTELCALRGDIENNISSLNDELTKNESVIADSRTEIYNEFYSWVMQSRTHHFPIMDRVLNLPAGTFANAITENQKKREHNWDLYCAAVAPYKNRDCLARDVMNAELKQNETADNLARAKDDFNRAAKFSVFKWLRDSTYREARGGKTILQDFIKTKAAYDSAKNTDNTAKTERNALKSVEAHINSIMPHIIYDEDFIWGLIKSYLNGKSAADINNIAGTIRINSSIKGSAFMPSSDTLKKWQEAETANRPLSSQIVFYETVQKDLTAPINTLNNLLCRNRSQDQVSFNLDGLKHAIAQNAETGTNCCVTKFFAIGQITKAPCALITYLNGMNAN